MNDRDPMPAADPAARLAGKTPGEEPQGRSYWRSLQQYADSPEFREKVAQEFTEYDPDELLGMSRRKFMKLAGASMALAGLTMTGCRRWPMEKIVPHNARPDGTMPGVPQTYASMLQRGGVAHGLFVTSFDGRPIHVAGSPLHPINGNPDAYDGGKGTYKVGAADSYSLASILDLYDPDRSRSVVRRTGTGDDRDAQRTSYAEFFGSLDLADGRVAVLSEAQSGPTFDAVKKSFLDKVPGATWTTWEPLHRDSEIAGARRAFGRAVRPHYDLSKAKVLALFDSDLLTDHPASVKHMRDWAKLRRSCDDPDNPQMSRVYALGPALTTTLSNADVHLQVKPSVLSVMLDALAQELNVPGFTGSPNLTGEKETKFIKALAKDLKAHQGESLVVVGPSQPAGLHALAWSINQTLGALGQTVTLTREPAGDTLAVDNIAQLVDQINADQIDTLLILGGNPVYDAPADLDFPAALAKVRTTVHLSQYDNETSRRCDWHLNEAHYLEAWGDGRAWDGTICLQQPIILPLFGGRTAIEVLATLAGDEATAGYDLVRRAWSAPLKAPQYDVARSGWVDGEINRGPEKAWRTAVHDGLLPGTGYEPLSLSPGNAGSTGVNFSADADRVQLVFRSDPKVYDGRYANNGWLQELPEPMTKVTWDNPVWISVTDAREWGVENGDVLQITVDGRSLRAAAFITPGQAPGTLVLTLGMGRTAAGRIGDNVGFNAYALRTTANQGVAYSAKVGKTGQSYRLAVTSIHHLIDPNKFGANWISLDDKDRYGTDAVARWGLDKRAGKKPGDEGKLIKQIAFADYLTNRDFANDDAHGDLTLQLYDAPLAEEHAARAEHLRAEAEALVAAGELSPEDLDGWMPATQFNDRHAWGMTIDMTACTGCSACIVACQSENNIPIVGKDQVLMSREMHWLRVDSYFRGDPSATSSDQLDAVHMPLACVHCENAPCEQVCPVAATVHDTEGLNTMVYNRCIGTRYCSNNCPYKVRRFNYFDYHAKLETDDFRTNRRDGGIQIKPWLKMPDQQQGDVIDQVRRMVFNPDVTVRMRGVMEKCTYCTQRINRARIDAKAQWALDKNAGMEVEDYPYVKDGDIVTACEGACPTGAITFGNLNDPTARVSRLQNLKKSPRAYKLLEELNSRPRTKHMGLVRNPLNKEKSEA
jgi:molybdopterin-containing oxidoreductase family iron-sulfur binding subunit